MERVQEVRVTHNYWGFPLDMWFTNLKDSPQRWLIDGRSTLGVWGQTSLVARQDPSRSILCDPNSPNWVDRVAIDSAYRVSGNVLG